ncbi:MAG: VOC family protein [Devosia sp.]|nr:VOC family protein [Devosia sp.]
MASFIIDYFELPTSSTATSREFFGRAFGFGSRDYGPGYTEVLGAGVLGGLNGAEDDRSTAPLIGVRTDDIEAAARAVTDAGGIITVPVRSYPGGRRFLFREPGGAELLVYCPEV